MNWGDIFIYSLIFTLTVTLVTVVLIRFKSNGTLIIDVNEDDEYVLTLQLDKDVPKIINKKYLTFDVQVRRWTPRR